MGKIKSVILEVTADKIELPVAIYLSTKEMAERLKITPKNAETKIIRQFTDKKRKTRFIRVYIN